MRSCTKSARMALIWLPATSGTFPGSRLSLRQGRCWNCWTANLEKNNSRSIKAATGRELSPPAAFFRCREGVCVVLLNGCVKVFQRRCGYERCATEGGGKALCGVLEGQRLYLSFLKILMRQEMKVEYVQTQH